MSVTRILLLLLTLLAPGAPALAQAEGNPVLRPGDVLTIDLPGETSISKDYHR